jgi:hypothetical protein
VQIAMLVLVPSNVQASDSELFFQEFSRFCFCRDIEELEVIY